MMFDLCPTIFLMKTENNLRAELVHTGLGSTSRQPFTIRPQTLATITIIISLCAAGPETSWRNMTGRRAWKPFVAM